MRALETNTDESSGSSEDHLHSIFQLEKGFHKYMITVNVNGIAVEMELDSGAERSTIPKTVFEEKLANACKLLPSTVSLHQYDHSPLMTIGECHANIEFNSQNEGNLCGSRYSRQTPIVW